MKEFNFEEISFTIIAHAGEAKGFAMGAIEEARNKNFAKAEEMIRDAEKSMIIASNTHFDVISAEAGGEKIQIPVLFMHAEDQLMSSENSILTAKEFIKLYEIMYSKCKCA